MPNFASACDRVGVSDRGAALLSTSLLEVGVLKSFQFIQRFFLQILYLSINSIINFFSITLNMYLSLALEKIIGN